MTMEEFNRAIEFAAEKHASKKRKGADLPYIVHPMEVCAIASTMTEDLEVLAAALLHDVIEDSDATEGDIKERFGERVAKLVAHESEDKMDHLPREESWVYRKQQALERLKGASRDAQIILLGDKLSNMRSIYREYTAMGDDVWQIFNMKDKARHAWYYRGIAGVLDRVRDTVAFREYEVLLDKIFG